ncbi:MAG: YidC/Oxa1 family insertase periplasmic-domain containing protein, partial [Muribaculaceae bacterium]|nr:YidC/Oxa1 family insertase periplasmic-domain containing protein [Muribaculaceae bacterium]
MDKNTLNGLLLMAAVFLLFMWLSPKGKEEAKNDNNDKAATEQVAQSSTDLLSETETEWLVNNISNNGNVTFLTDSSRVTNLSQAGVNLSLKGDSIYGYVVVNGRQLDWNDVCRADLSKMSVNEQRQAVEIVRNLSTNMGKYGKFAKFTTGENKTVRLQNDVLALDLSSKSGSITRAELKKYDTEYSADETKKVKNKVVIFEGDHNKFNFSIPLPQPIETADLYFTPQQINDSTVRMTLDVAPDSWWGIEYTLPKGDSYVVKMNIVQHNMANVVMSNNRNLGFSWMQDVHRQEQGRMFEERNSGLYYKFAGGDVEHLSESKNASEERQAKIKWIGFKNQFFSSVMIADKNFHSADFNSEVLKGSDFLKKLSTEATVNDYDWNAERPVAFSLYIGPNLYPLLSHLDKSIDPEENLHLTRLIPLG